MAEPGGARADLAAAPRAAFPCSDEINFTVADAAASREKVADAYLPRNPRVATLDGLSMEFDDWRFNLRASNTEPLLRLNVETRGNAALVMRKVEEISALIAAR